MILNPVDYALISQIPFDAPVHPGPLVIVQGTSATMATATHDTHTEAVCLFREYHRVEKALKQQLCKAIDESYLLALHDRTLTPYLELYTAFSTTLTLLMERSLLPCWMRRKIFLNVSGNKPVCLWT